MSAHEEHGSLPCSTCGQPYDIHGLPGIVCKPEPESGAQAEKLLNESASALSLALHESAIKIREVLRPIIEPELSRLTREIEEARKELGTALLVNGALERENASQAQRIAGLERQLQETIDLHVSDVNRLRARVGELQAVIQRGLHAACNHCGEKILAAEAREAQAREEIRVLREALKEQGSLRNVGYNERNCEDGNSPDESGVTLEEYKASGDRIDAMRLAALAQPPAQEPDTHSGYCRRCGQGAGAMAHIRSHYPGWHPFEAAPHASPAPAEEEK